MFTSFAHKAVLCVSLGLTFILSGCMTSAPEELTQTQLELSDSIISKNKGDVWGLYNDWIVPHLIKNRSGGYSFIPHASGMQRTYSIGAVRGGFERFCSASGGVYSKTTEKKGVKYSCKKADGSYIGTFDATRLTASRLQVTVDTPEQIMERQAKESALMMRKAQNGPTGVVITEDGKFNFLRLGNMDERDVMEIRLNTVPRKYIPIEDVKKIEFQKKCCEIDITFRNGTKLSVNQERVLNRIRFDRVRSYNEFPFVILDSKSGQPYMRLYGNSSEIKAIIFDDPSVWKNKPSGVIATKFDYSKALKDRLDKYTQDLRLHAVLLMAKAKQNGWIQALPDSKLTPQLSVYLSTELRQISSSSECFGYKNKVTTGIRDFDAPLKCKVASRELDIKNDGYALSPELTPLSTIIIVNKLEKDLR